MTKAKMIETIKNEEQYAWKLFNTLESALDKDSDLLIMYRSRWALLRELMDHLEIEKDYCTTED